MVHRLTCWIAVAGSCLVLFLGAKPLAAAEKVLFDFENGADLAAAVPQNKRADATPAAVAHEALQNSPGPKTPAKAMELGRSPISYAQAQKFNSPSFNGHDLLGANSPWFAELRRDISKDPVDPHSDEMLRRMVQAKGTVNANGISGPFTPPTWNWYTMPFNVVSGNTPKRTIKGTWSYCPAGAGPYLLPPEPVVSEGNTLLTYPVDALPSAGDHHHLFLVRDEQTGGPLELWEYYQLVVKKDTAGNWQAIAGASYRRFDLKNGENPYADTGSTDAAGLPITPLLIFYDEVASGAIRHTLRGCLNNSDICPKYIWPSRMNAGAWNPKGIPYGGRMRIKQSWWDANADNVLGVKTQARVVGEAMRKHGIIVADGTGGSSIEMCGVADMRWDKDFVQRLNRIPVSAFEVIDLPSTLEITGPKTVKVGQAGTWTVGYKNPNELGPAGGANVNIYTYDPTKMSKKDMVVYPFVGLKPDNRSGTNSHAFKSPGSYMIAPYQDFYAGWEGGFVITVMP
jgi:hypothetical protein